MKRSVPSLLLAASTLLVACGIDQGGIQTSATPQSMAATTLVSGPITGFGSVLVNDLTLDTSVAQILVDGRPATESDLRVGQIIRALATQEGGPMRALLIEYEESLIGPIAELDPLAGQLLVLGQTIRVDAATRFDGLESLDELVVAEPIEISGFVRPAGEIVATYIGRAAQDRGFQITASIGAVDAPNLSFGIGALTVDYSQVVVLDVADGEPNSDTVVEVRGKALQQDVLVADEVRALSFLPGALRADATVPTTTEATLLSDGAESLGANFMGFVTALALPGELTLDSVAVAIDADTIFVGGTADDLDIGARIQVEGAITGASIAARRITLLAI